MPLADVNDFGKSAMGLTGRHLTRVDFNQLVATIQAKYSQAKKWLQWHLNNNVGKFIFPAMSAYDNSHITKDTNAQESLGNDFKQSAMKKQVNINEAIQHSYQYMKNIKTDYEQAAKGRQLQYK
ncbi:MAG: hypothetical protein BYD32DRAFT_465098 [Podila humilis]|nr:MAG: hypothetical protein BYD32DRAFT_465098 [Podila humilis]